MNREGFIEFNTSIFTENSGKADSYARAIEILDNVLSHQDAINLNGKSLYSIHELDLIEAIWYYVNDEAKKMRLQQPNIFDAYGDPNQRSYPLKNFCTAALRSLKEYAKHENETIEADRIVAQESNPQVISKKLIDHFDINRIGEDNYSMKKERKGQTYFRRMILKYYNCRCALTGIDIPQLLLASHIIPWKDKSHKIERLNPCNGICLSALYDKAFDKGLITISPDDYTIQISSALLEYKTQAYYDKHFGNISGKQITLPTEYKPDRDFLAYHKEKVFRGI